MGSGRVPAPHELEPAWAPPPPPLRVLRTLNHVLEKVEDALLVTLILTMVTLAFAQVLLRVLRPYNPTFQPVPWFGPFTQHLVVWVGLIGASIATREGRHFGVEALTKSLGTRGRRRLDAVLSTVSCAFSVCLAVLAWNHLVLRELKAASPVFEIESLGHLKVMRWQLLVIVPFELAAMSFRFFLRTLEAVLLGDETWEAHDKSLRPELEQQGVEGVPEAAVVAAGAGTGAGTVATEAPPAKVEAEAEKPRKPERSTDKVRTYRLADTGDVIEPEQVPGEPNTDDEAALVDSEVSLDSTDEATAEYREAKALTERTPVEHVPPPDTPPPDAPPPAPEAEGQGGAP